MIGLWLGVPETPVLVYQLKDRGGQNLEVAAGHKEGLHGEGIRGGEANQHQMFGADVVVVSAQPEASLENLGAATYRGFD
ncbi:hypothetical protein H4V95_001202 [Arthrobacter sp. CAN_C5]|nr:hypothetical protein [Arthrobacter sp. CAN_C5]MBP2216011.1 hypothetical protein [Arthrobacter sp. CAN_C5]